MDSKIQGNMNFCESYKDIFVIIEVRDMKFVGFF